MDSGCEAEEANILSLSVTLLSLLREQRMLLDKRFNRTPEATEKDCEARPQQPNALDEIIDNLITAITKLIAVNAFFSNEVLPKIS